MAIGKTGRYSFTKQYSTWQINQAWKAKRRDMVERFQTQSVVASSSFMNAWTNQISGATELTAQSTVARLQSEAKAKQAKALSQINLSV